MTSFLQALVQAAKHRSARVAFWIEQGEQLLSEGAEASGLLVPENSLAQIYLRGAADAQGQFPGESHADSMRLIALTFDAVVTSRQAGALAPDLLGLTIRSLASPELPHTADVARFAVMLSLRARYSVRYLASTTVLLRAAYDSVRRRLDDSQRTVTSLECFLHGCPLLRGVGTAWREYHLT